MTPELLRRADAGTRKYLLALAGEAAANGWSVSIRSWEEASSLSDRLYRSRCFRIDKGTFEPPEMPDLIMAAIAKVRKDRKIKVTSQARRRKPKFPKRAEAVPLKSTKEARQAIEVLEHGRWWMRELRSGDVLLWWD